MSGGPNITLSKSMVRVARIKSKYLGGSRRMGAGERREEAARATEAEYTLTKGLVRPGLGYLKEKMCDYLQSSCIMEG